MSSKILTFGSLNIDYVYSVDHFVQKGETLASSAQGVKPVCCSGESGGGGVSCRSSRAGRPVFS